MKDIIRKQEIGAALSPRGYMKDIELIPLASRPQDLSRKLVYLVNSWGAGSGLDHFLGKASDKLKKQYSNLELISINKPSPYFTDDPELWDEMQENADAFVYAAAPSCSTTSWAMVWASGLEKRGIPGVVIIYDSLIDDAEAACQRLGMSLRWVAVPYPTDSMTKEQVSKSMYAIVQAITMPLELDEKKTGTQTPPKPPRIALKGSLDEIQDFFYDQGWTDGLPIIPPTEDRVAQMLKGTSHSPDEVTTKTMWPEEWEVTVENVAVNSVMAGCKPEYMPVLLAAVEAFAVEYHAPRVKSTNSFSFMQVVNGPIRNEIGMNSGTYALGPGNHPNATIGRALSLFIINLGGGEIGVNMMGTQGNVSSYTFCFAENEEASPWASFALEQGYNSKESTITIFSGGFCHTGNYLAHPLGDLIEDIACFEWPNGVVALISPQRARALAEEGHSKERLKEHIWRNATSTMKAFRSNVYYKIFVEPILKGKEYHGEKYLWPKEYLELPDDAIVPIYPRKYVYVIVVGGEANPMMQGWHMSSPSSVSIDKWR